jgi:hypothetical protein
VPSASAARASTAALALCLLLAVVAAGCKTTQQSNDRLEIRAKRTIEARTPIDVTRVNPDVKVVRAVLVRGKGGGAVVVTLVNTGSESATELPLEVGVKGDGGEEALNAGKTLGYAENHAPALEPGQETTWVFKTGEPLPAGDTAFAKIGAEPADPLTAPGDDLPDLEAVMQGTPTGGSLSVKITNKSDIPQYDLGVYATAKKGRRFVVAGQATIEHIGSNEDKTVAVPLIGDPKDATVQLFITPTYFE